MNDETLKELEKAKRKELRLHAAAARMYRLLTRGIYTTPMIDLAREIKEIEEFVEEEL